MDKLGLRIATLDDADAIRTLQERAIEQLQAAYLSTEQIEASRLSMGLDTQLIRDRTYFCVFAQTENGPALAGCGGWSYRATLYGNNASSGRSPRPLDPQTERARIRAMFTDPDHTRRGVARLILDRSEEAAREAGFRALEMAATEAGKPFYLKCGYTVEAAFEDRAGAVPVPLYTMVKAL